MPKLQPVYPEWQGPRDKDGISSNKEWSSNKVKQCSRCGVKKPLSEFGIRNTTKDGHNAACRICINQQSNKHYANKLKNNPEYHKKRRQQAHDKYKNDSEFRAYSKQRTSKYYNNKCKNNPKYYKKHNQQAHDKYKNNPEFSEREKQRCNDKYKNNPEFKEKVKQRAKNYLQTDHGREVIYTRIAKRHRDMKWIKLSKSRIWPKEIEIEWHHINDWFVFPVPLITHKSMLGKEHRQKVNNWLEEKIGQIGI